MFDNFDQDAEHRAAASSIAVPDELEAVVFDDEQPDPMGKIATLVAQGGEDVLTEEEYVLYREWQRSQHGGDSAGHNTNLAEVLDEAELNNIAARVIEWVSRDESSRSDWFEREKKGIQDLGLSKKASAGAPFKGASQVVHPIMAEAIVQFAARAMESLWPAGGPVKTAIMGASDEAVQGQSQRVEQFMNYQYTQLMPGAYEQTDNMLVRLPLSGSVFMKVHYDPIDGVKRSMVEPANFIVPYRANDLLSTPRYTERIMMPGNELRKRQVAGVYRDIRLGEPHEVSGEAAEVEEAIKASEGRSDTGYDAEDQNHTVLECVCELDLPGFKDTDAQGKETRIALPYIVTLDADSQKVLSIYRNWRPSDENKKRIIFHVHYRFMPGLGFYGFGLYHWIGGLADAATGSLRALLDSAQFANMQGGYRSRDAKIVACDDALAPGEWRETDADAEELAKAFYRVPYKEPSSTLFSLLGHLETLGQRFASTTEAMIGDGAQNTPVGTILARIEQGTKIHTSIQKRLHRAAAEEFKLVAWLNSLYLADEYPYAVEGEDRVALRDDFDERIDVVPVSDPNYASNTQRYFMSQALLEISAKAPDLYDRRELHKRVLESIKTENIEALLPEQGGAVARMGPVEEGAAAIMGTAIKAYAGQEHDAHLTVHQQLLMQLGEKHPAAAVLHAHTQEHIALAYLQRYQLATGQEFTLPGAEPEPEPEHDEVPVAVENQIAMAAAETAAAMMVEAQAQAQAQAEANAPSQNRPDERAAELQFKQKVAEADTMRKDKAADADIARADRTAQAQLKQENMKLKLKAINEKTSQLARTGMSE